MNDSSVQLY